MTSPSQTTKLMRIVVPAALKVLTRAEGKQLRVRDLLAQLEEEIDFDSWARERLTSGDARWRKIFGWYSLGMADAGFIIKRAGIWYLTPEGEAAVKMPGEKILEVMHQAYWAKREDEKLDSRNPNEQTPEISEEQPVSDSAAVALDQAVASASEGLRARLHSLSPWDAQRVVAGLLRAMGFHTPFIAPERTKDGGLDILAYRDPLGSFGGRVKVQVKHKTESKAKAEREEIQRLASMVQSDTQESGLFVSTFGFSQPAKDFARDTKQHIELWDGERVLELWREFYSSLDESSRNLIRLRMVSFFDSGRAGTDPV